MRSAATAPPAPRSGLRPHACRRANSVLPPGCSGVAHPGFLILRPRPEPVESAPRRLRRWPSATPYRTRPRVAGLSGYRDDGTIWLSFVWPGNASGVILSVSRAGSLPHTHIGRWLRALMLDQRELRDNLVSTLNNGEPIGWNDDEPAVVVACCELVIRQCWPDGPTQADVEALCALCEAAFTQGSVKPASPGSIEAVIRATLRGNDDRAPGVSSGDSYRISTLLAGLLADQADLSETEVDELVKKAERAAFDRRWHPPLARRQRT
jgi:hypothetical protein